MNIDIGELIDFYKAISNSTVKNESLPAFPYESVTNLNFLKPGSREVLHRKMHIQDYFPPMYPDLETEDQNEPANMATSSGISIKEETDAGK